MPRKSAIDCSASQRPLAVVSDFYSFLPTPCAVDCHPLMVDRRMLVRT